MRRKRGIVLLGLSTLSQNKSQSWIAAVNKKPLLRSSSFDCWVIWSSSWEKQETDGSRNSLNSWHTFRVIFQPLRKSLSPTAKQFQGWDLSVLLFTTGCESTSQNKESNLKKNKTYAKDSALLIYSFFKIPKRWKTHTFFCAVGLMYSVFIKTLWT